SSTFTAEEIPYVGEMTLRAKRKSVEKASARRCHAAGAPKDIPVTPWGEWVTCYAVHNEAGSR
ncbi:hypothetical protein PC121_g4177, partial [Phytophthora cactorum]